MTSVKDKLSRVGTSFFVHLAEQRYIEDVIQQPIVWLEHTNPQEILNAAVNNVKFNDANKQQKEEWLKQLQAGVRLAVRYNKVAYIRRIIANYDGNRLFKIITDEATKKGYKRALYNLSFIAGTPICYQWYRNVLEQTRNWILENYDRISREYQP